MDMENGHVVANGETVGISRCTLLHRGWIHSKVCSSGNHIQYLVMTCNEKECEK